MAASPVGVLGVPKEPTLAEIWKKGMADSFKLPHLPCAMSTRVSCGHYHSLACTENLTLLAWGGNYYGQVGDGTCQDRTRPTTVLKNDVGGGIIACAAGRVHSLAVTAAGEVYAWGNNEDCLLGTGWKQKQETPTKVIEKGATAVAAGFKHSLALTKEGEVFAWGSNDYGQLGDGTRTSRRSPVKVIGGGVKTIVCGWYHNVAITFSGDVWTWGFTNQDATSGNQRTLVPEMIIHGGVASVAAGCTHSLALTEEGALLAWGGNNYGQLGDGTMSRRITPITVASGCIRIAAGSYHSLAIDANYNILMWGFKMACTAYGDGSWSNEPTPAKVHLEGGGFQISAGGVHSLCVSHRGDVWCWGGNSSGQIGDGKLKDRDMPISVTAPNTVETIPLSVLIAKAMKGPEEMAADEAREAKQKERQERPKSSVQKLASSGVPGLMRKAIGDFEDDEDGSLGPTYPLSYNGCAGKATSSLSSGNLGFVPGTGFRPGQKGNSLSGLTWPDGPGMNNPHRRKRLTYVCPKSDMGLAIADRRAAQEQEALADEEEDAICRLDSMTPQDGTVRADPGERPMSGADATDGYSSAGAQPSIGSRKSQALTVKNMVDHLNTKPLHVERGETRTKALPKTPLKENLALKRF